MTEKIVFNIDGQTGRIDKILADFMTGTSRSQIQAWVKDGNLMVNDKAVKSNYKVQEGDLSGINDSGTGTDQCNAGGHCIGCHL